MNKKVLVSFLLVGAILANVFIGCASKTTVDIFVYDEEDTFMQELTSNVVKQMPKDITANVFYASNAQSAQNKQIVSSLEDKTDLLLVNIVDRVSSSGILQKCKDKNTPIIFYNREPLESDLAMAAEAYYVGAAPESTGIMQGRLLDEVYDNKANFAKYDVNADNRIQLIVLKGQEGHQDAEKRTQCCIDELERQGYSLDILAVEVANWRRDEAYEIVKKLYDERAKTIIKNGKNIELILANNDDMALGAIDFLQEKSIFNINTRGFDQPIMIVGVDGTAKGIEAIDNGLLYATVLNDAAAQSDAIVKLIDYILNKKDIKDFPYAFTNDRYIYIEGKIVLKSDKK